MNELETRTEYINSRLKIEAGKQKEYASLFYEKIEAYLKKVNYELVGDMLTTKLIRVTADKS